MAKSNDAEKPLTFESALAELEGIVSTMEAGELTLEQSLSSYQRGAVLLKFCQAQLAQAHERVRVLEAGELTPLSDTKDQQ
jgi:exodeoxyribonuclease VII small subunit